MNSSNDPAVIDGVGLGVIPKQQRGVEVRDRLFDAAIVEFTARGVEGSRVENIVAAAGTSWGTFFRYFPRKEDVLLYAAAQHFRDFVRPAYDEGLADPDRPTRGVLGEVFAAVMSPRLAPELHAAFLDQTVRFPARFAAILNEGELPIVILASNLVERGQARGEVRTDIPAMECALVIGAGVMFSTRTVLGRVARGELPGSEIGVVAERALDLVWTGLEHSPSGDQAS